MAIVREFSRTPSTRSSSTAVLNQSPVLMASEGARPPPGLKLGAPLAQPPLGYSADWSPLLPSQVARSAPPSPPPAAAGRPVVVSLLLPPLPPPPPSSRPVQASRARCAVAVRMLMCRACTLVLSLTNLYLITLTTAAMHVPRIHAIPGPRAPICSISVGVQAALAPLPCALERCCPAAEHTLTAHSYTCR